jgi:hypothetical protein
MNIYDNIRFLKEIVYYKDALFIKAINSSYFYSNSNSWYDFTAELLIFDKRKNNKKSINFDYEGYLLGNNILKIRENREIFIFTNSVNNTYNLENDKDLIKLFNEIEKFYENLIFI